MELLNLSQDALDYCMLYTFNNYNLTGQVSHAEAVEENESGLDASTVEQADRLDFVLLGEQPVSLMPDPEIVEEEVQAQASTVEAPEISFPQAAFSLMKKFSQVQDNDAPDSVQPILSQEDAPEPAIHFFADEQDADVTLNFLTVTPVPIAVDVSKQTAVGNQLIPASPAPQPPAHPLLIPALPSYDGKFVITILTMALVSAAIVALLSTIFDPAMVAIINTHRVDNSLAQAGQTPAVGPISSYSPPLTPSSARVPAKKTQPAPGHKGKSGGTATTSGGTKGGTQSVPKSTPKSTQKSAPAPVPTPTPTPQPAPTPTPTPVITTAAVPVAGTYYYIMNNYSGKVLDDTNWSTSNGTVMQQWSEVSGQTDQEWSFIPASSGFYYIMNRHSGKVLDDTNWSTSNGTTVQQWSEVSGQADQEWSLSSAGSGFYYIVNRFSGKVLDDTNWSTSNGTMMQQWSEVSGQANQEWSLTAA